VLRLEHGEDSRQAREALEALTRQQEEASNDTVDNALATVAARAGRDHP
jgi:hypothetical protein